MQKSIRTIRINGYVQVYVMRDNEGFISLSTDGWAGKELDPIIAAICSLQDQEDRTLEADTLQGWAGPGPDAAAVLPLRGEREAVVAWLRHLAAMSRDWSEHADVYDAIADNIENGEHRREGDE